MIVRDLFGHKVKPGVLGLELEVESLAEIPTIKSNIWLVKEDGSLRNNGYEYYTRNPIPNDHLLRERISELIEFLQNPKFKVDYNSTRTSFHVHVNVSHMTMMQMWTQVFAYWLLEQPLMNICGKSRCGNQFCLRCKDAEGQVFQVARLLKSPKDLGLFNNDNLRYASQNLKALHTFGSLEYRGMRGAHDVPLLYDWASGLATFSNNTLKFASPVDLFMKFDKMNRREFILSLLPYSLARRVLEQSDYTSTTSDNFDILFDLVYETDWEKVRADYVKNVVVETPNPWTVGTVNLADRLPTGADVIVELARQRRSQREGRGPIPISTTTSTVAAANDVFVNENAWNMSTPGDDFT